MMLTSCSAEIENHALMLKGDGPEHCTQTAIMPRDYDYYLGQVEVEEELCVTYEYSLGKFVVRVRTISENQLRFWVEDSLGRPVELEISSDHPCDGTHSIKSVYTFRYKERWPGAWDDSNADPSLESRSAGLLLDESTWLTNEKQEQLVEERQLHPDPKERYFCYQRPVANPITVLLTAEEHDFRVEVPVAVWHNGYTVAVVAI